MNTTKREFSAPRDRSAERSVSQAERNHSRPRPLDVASDYYGVIERPSHAENERLASTDRKDLARRNVPLVVFVVANLLRVTGSQGKRPASFMASGLPKIGFGSEHRGMADDLVQDGIIGLMRACETFDPAKGTLATHAIPHIINAIQHGDSRHRAIPLPVEVERLARRDPHLLTAAQRDSAHTVMRGFADLGKSVLTGDEVKQDFAGPVTLGESLVMPEADQGDEMTAHASLDQLDDLERKVIEHRYGIVGEPLDLQATGTKLGLTRREVREIERRAMKKMQAMA